MNCHRTHYITPTQNQLISELQAAIFLSLMAGYELCCVIIGNNCQGLFTRAPVIRVIPVSWNQSH